MKTPTLVLMLWTLAGCARPGAPSEAPPDEPPQAVTALTVAHELVEERTEYLATLSSRRAVSVYPQVSGYVRAIAVKPGGEVKAGAVLLSIDAAPDQATLDNLLATRQAQAAALQFARERAQRSTVLRQDGIVSQQDLDQAQVSVDQAQASLQATEALVASQRARLALYTLTAPFAGVVGNVPVKVGDFVTPATLLTSVTQDAGLEAEVWVPVERAASLGPQSLVRLLDERGQKVAQSQVVFVSPRVDPATQLVLVKGAFEALPGLRPDQALRAQVVWSQHDGLLVPTVSVVRQAGQPFVYVVGQADGGAAQVAVRVPVSLGDLVGPAYVVREGLQPGQQVIVSGVQLVADGRLVRVTPATSGGR